MSFSDRDFDDLLSSEFIPDLNEETRKLVERVNNIDHTSRMLDIKPDPILVGIDVTKRKPSGLLRRLRAMRQTIYVRGSKMNDSKIKRAREEHGKKKRLKEYESKMFKDENKKILQD